MGGISCGDSAVEEATYLLKSCYRYFRDGTIHAAVVDPGVGTSRRAGLGHRDRGRGLVDRAALVRAEEPRAAARQRAGAHEVGRHHRAGGRAVARRRRASRRRAGNPKPRIKVDLLIIDGDIRSQLATFPVETKDAHQVGAGWCRLDPPPGLRPVQDGPPLADGDRGAMLYARAGLLCYVLDREMTMRGSTLDALMRRLYEERGLRRIPWREQDIVVMVEALAHHSLLSGFFAGLVPTSARLPLDGSFELLSR